MGIRASSPVYRGLSSRAQQQASGPEKGETYATRSTSTQPGGPRAGGLAGAARRRGADAGPAGPNCVRRRHELLPRFAAYYTQLQALPAAGAAGAATAVAAAPGRPGALAGPGAAARLAATIPVGGACTLVDAITAANTDTATGGCPAGSGADTIVLPAGSTQTLTEVNNDTYGPTGLPVISSVITIAGQGSTIARASGAPEFRLLR